MNRIHGLFFASFIIFVQLIPSNPPNSHPSMVSTIIVTSTADSGPGSLRQAIADAASGDCITFSSQIHGQAITLLSSLTISKDLTITGPGASQLAVHGAGVVGLIAVRGGAVVTVSGLTIRDGVRGIDNQGGNLTIIDCVITGNSAGPPWDGAGIYNKDGSLTLRDSQVTGNSVVYASGGGIANSNATLTIDGSLINNNSALYRAAQEWSISPAIRHSEHHNQRQHWARSWVSAMMAPCRSPKAR
jgi:hypothetical protein